MGGRARPAAPDPHHPRAIGCTGPAALDLNAVCRRVPGGRSRGRGGHRHAGGHIRHLRFDALDLQPGCFKRTRERRLLVTDGGQGCSGFSFQRLDLLRQALFHRGQRRARFLYLRGVFLPAARTVSTCSASCAVCEAATVRTCSMLASASPTRTLTRSTSVRLSCQT